MFGHELSEEDSMLQYLKRNGRLPFLALLLLILLIISVSAQSTSVHHGHGKNKFVRRFGSHLVLEGRPFRFAGTNNYYLMYKSQFMVDDMLETAVANDFNVVRTWAFFDVGTLDDSAPTSIHGPQEGVYFQYWDTETGAPAYNDGPDGLERLDYVVYKAGQEGIKLVLPLTNNWGDFGGMDQYIRWREAQFEPGEREFYHTDFYTDEIINQWYKEWIAHLLNRTNIYTGLQYKDDPTIMTWELGNEPRCVGSGNYPKPEPCSTEDITNWADDMSGFIKSIDSNHLVSVGDEGFYCDANATEDTHWTENCGEGVDTIALTKLRHIDVMSYHLYPDHWDTDADWGVDWIKRHIVDARRLRKPAMLGEFGWQEKSTRNTVFKEWTDTVYLYQGAGALYWILSGNQDGGSLYPDYDGFTVYCPSTVCTTLGNFADMMSSRARWWKFPPVADHDVAVTDYQIPVVLTPAANDVAYGFRNLVKADTIDLDPAMAGQQTTLLLPDIAEVTLQADGTVLVTPDPEFFGKIESPYTIQDRWRRVSNTANLVVTVLPPPPPPFLMSSFEDGIAGWGDSWESPGVLSQSSDWATAGSYSLRADNDAGGWYQTDLVPAPPTGYTYADYIRITVDVKTLETGSSLALVFRTGDDWNWCQSNFEWIPENSETTFEVDLLNGLSCDNADLADVRALNLFVNGGSMVYIDNIVAE